MDYYRSKAITSLTILIVRRVFRASIARSLCYGFVPAGKPFSNGEDYHAKRKRDSSGAATRTRCLGIQVARTERRRQTKTSQNSSRISRPVGRRSSCSSSNFRFPAGVQSWRRVAQGEIDGSLRPCVPLSGTRARSGYGLENAFDQGHVPGLSEQVDSAALGEVFLGPRQRWRGRALVEVVAAGQIKLRQNQESHERSIQSRNPT
jgi:hypothetical protein